MNDFSYRQIYEGISNIPENDLQQLGWIARSIPVRDIANLTIGDIDTIAAFGQYHNLSHAQVSLTRMLSKYVT